MATPSTAPHWIYQPQYALLQILHVNQRRRQLDGWTADASIKPNQTIDFTNNLVYTTWPSLDNTKWPTVHTI